MPYKIAADIHTHTLYSQHAYSTILENVKAAQDAGLEVLGSADHLSCMTAAELDLRNYQFFINQSIWPRMWDNLLLLRGAEVDILSLDGKLFGQDVPVENNITGHPYKYDHTLFELCAEGLDYLVASVHRNDFADGATIAQTTEMYIRALENPKVFVLGHTGRSSVPFDIDEVVLAAKAKHKLIEINEHSLESDSQGRSVKACRKIAERCAELGVGITVSTDAHIAPAIGKFDLTQNFLEEIHFPQELIVGKSRAALLDEMRAAGVCDLVRYT